MPNPELPPTPDAVSAEIERHVVELLEQELVTMHFQPIVDLARRRLFAYEALCRPQTPAFRSPPELIEAAVSVGHVGELGRRLRQIAVAGCPAYALFLNIIPNEFDQGWLVRPDDPIFRHRMPVYLEITEATPLKYFEQCHSVLGELRKKGVMLAIDDLGAGYSNLKYIADLKPEIVKLDRELVKGISIDTAEYTLLRSITRLCHEMGARVIAEGIETHEELEAVYEAGVDYGQGYLLARPAEPPPQPDWPFVDGLLSRARGHRKRAPAQTDSAPLLAGDLRAEIESLEQRLQRSEAQRLRVAHQLKKLLALPREEWPDVPAPEN